MPPLADRENFEASIVAGLEPIFQAEFERAISSPGPSIAPYSEFQADLQQTMQGELFDVFKAAGTALMIGNAIVLSQGAFEETARRWSEGMSRELAAQVVESSQRMTADAFAIAKGDGEKLAQALALVYMADSRLAAIAATETTRAVSAGEQSVVFFFRHDDAPRLAPVWETEKDRRVCEICWPLDGHGRLVYGADFPLGPPAHPMCRCSLQWIAAVDIGRDAA
jgi:hypothetical protein